ncbi:ribonuclease domain-containing protein [Paracidovorax citrulli]
MAVALAQPAQHAAARETPSAVLDGMGTIAVQRLPNEARVTLQRIETGGPYPYAKDGTRFGNYERLLPRQPRGYYREYTVAKPDSRNRGPRRIVCGGPKRTVDDCYYTEDHYNSFKRITR